MIEKYMKETHAIHAGWRVFMKKVTKVNGEEAFSLPPAWRCIPYITEEVGEYLAAYYANLDDEGAYTRRNDEKGNQELTELNHITMMCSSYVLAMGNKIEDLIKSMGFSTIVEPGRSAVATMLEDASDMINCWEKGSQDDVTFLVLSIWARACNAMGRLPVEAKVSIFAESLAERKRMVANKHSWPR